MTTISKGDKSIQIKIENIACESTDEDNRSISYIIQAPKIICNDKKDAEYIHQKINDFTMSLCRELLEPKGEEKE